MIRSDKVSSFIFQHLNLVDYQHKVTLLLAKSSLESTADQLKTANDKIHLLESSLSKNETELVEKEQLLTDALKLVDEIQVKKNALQSNFDKLSTEAQKSGNDVSEKVKRVNDLEAQLAALTKQLSDKKAELAAKEQEVNELTSQLQAAEAQVECSMFSSNKSRSNLITLSFVTL